MRTALALSLAAFAATSVPAGAAPVLGEFEGTGRACAGKLQIGPERIVWRTPFSRCGPTAYRVADRSSAGGLAVDYVLIRPGKACRYAALTLTRSAEGGWNVSGYETLADLAAQDTSKALNCYLTK